MAIDYYFYSIEMFSAEELSSDSVLVKQEYGVILLILTFIFCMQICNIIILATCLDVW